MPFFHSGQMEAMRIPILGSVTGDNAANSIMGAFKATDLRYSGGVWQVRNQTPTGDQWETLADQQFYIPEFRVIAVTVGIADPSGTPDNFYHLNFDMPTPGNMLYNFSDANSHPAVHGNGDWFPTGVMRPCWITRVRFTSQTTATKISLWG